jgi:hypothetical protein
MITFICNHWRWDAYEAFMRVISEMVKLMPAEIFASRIMPNDWHLVLRKSEKQIRPSRSRCDPQCVHVDGAAETKYWSYRLFCLEI